MTDCLCCKEKMSTEKPRICPVPDCRKEFKGKGWEGIDAHWRANHEAIMLYEEFRDSLCPKHGGALKEYFGLAEDINAIIREARRCNLDTPFDTLKSSLDKLSKCETGDHTIGLNDLYRRLINAEDRVLKILTIKQDRQKYQFAMGAAVVGWIFSLILLLVNIFKSPPPC